MIAAISTATMFAAVLVHRVGRVRVGVVDSPFRFSGPVDEASGVSDPAAVHERGSPVGACRASRAR
jgi:hypothetical protein